MQGQQVHFKCRRCRRAWDGRFYAPMTPDSTAFVECTLCRGCEQMKHELVLGQTYFLKDARGKLLMEHRGI
jgi:hypothetical protein